MNSVLVIAFGPVQGFVAAARKTQDLTIGSRLLSDVTRAAADAIRSTPGVDVVVPPASLRGDSTSNKIVALVETDQAASVAEEIRTKALERLKEIVDSTQSGVPASSLDEQAFKAQVNTFLECYWATAILPSPDRFGAARELADRALDGRKVLRDFDAHMGIGNREKASVDGRLESVILKPAMLRQRRGPAVLREREQLDAMGLVRRCWDVKGSRAPSTAVVALTPWRKAVEADSKTAGPLADVLKAQEGLKAAIRQQVDTAPDLEIFDELAWALEALPMRERDIFSLWTSAEPKEDVPETVKTALATFEGAVEKLLGKAGSRGLKPTSYLAVIAADGDRIGAAFSGLRTAGQHVIASSGLAEFARGVHAFGQTNDIHVVYAGGDDVLALAPLDRVLPFVRRMRTDFANVRPAFGGVTLTLSVGVAIVHHSDRLSESVRLARDAEQMAKHDPDGATDGDALAIVLSKRSGGDVSVRLPFAAAPEDALEELIRVVRDGEIARGLAHEIAAVAPDLAATPGAAAFCEIERIVKRKRKRNGDPIDPALVLKLLALAAVSTTMTGEALVQGCRHLSALLRIALHFAEHTQARSDGHAAAIGIGEST